MANLGTSILALLSGGATGFAQGKARRNTEDRADAASSQAAEERRTTRAQQAADRAEEKRIRDQQVGIESTRATEEAQRAERRDKAAAEERAYQHGRDTVEDTFKEIQAATNKKLLDQDFAIKHKELENQGLQNIITVLRATKEDKTYDPTANAQKFYQQGIIEALKGLSDVSSDPEKQKEHLRGISDFLRQESYKMFGTTGNEQLDGELRAALSGNVAGALPDTQAPTFDSSRQAFEYPGRMQSGPPVDISEILNPRIRALAGTLRTEK